MRQLMGISPPEAQGGEVHAVDGLIDLAPDARREEVAARVPRDRGRRNVVALELEREPVGGSIALCP
jgi:hypothetical protein